VSAVALKETIKLRVREAMKAGRTLEKEILRVALGEIETEDSRREEPLGDAEVEKIVRKLIKSNHETLKQSAQDQQSTLEEEIAILESVLPKQLSEAQITETLASVADAIRQAGNDGQATGVAMKHLKQVGANVDGKTVSAAVRSIRA
jgi:uncharacterized protein YqeY